MTGWVGVLSLLDVVPVFNRLIILKTEYFETDIRICEVIFRVSEYIVAILEYSDDIDARRGFRQSLEQRR
jgi:hypothetical protein